MLDNIAIQNKSVMIFKKRKISVCWKTWQTRVIFSVLKNQTKVKSHLNKYLLRQLQPCQWLPHRMPPNKPQLPDASFTVSIKILLLLLEGWLGTYKAMWLTRVWSQLPVKVHKLALFIPYGVSEKNREHLCTYLDGAPFFHVRRRKMSLKNANNLRGFTFLREKIRIPFGCN